jgi:23S rRNA (uracil1939-C5)-methyltransferase
MVHGGGCLGRTDDGETMMVDGAIPGEEVVAAVSGRRGGVTRVGVVEVVEASADRVTPPCPYVGECGGCDMQHVAYPRQLQLKRDIVIDALRRQGVALPATIGVHGMDDPWRYRWRGEFHVVPGTQGTRDAGLGFNRARSWRPVAVDDCLIHHATITASLPALREAVHRGADDRLSVLHLTVGEDGAELLIQPKPQRALDPAVLDEIALGTRAPAPRWATQGTTLRWRGHEYRVTPQSFIQVNQRQMDVLYQRVLDALGDLGGQRIVDAYAGIGVLSVELAARVGDSGAVICIEESDVSARLGLLNARLNGFEQRISYDRRSVEEALPDAAAHGAAAVVLDPPRAGCAGSVTGWLALAGPPLVVYVSCDPATLARDLHVLVASGPYAVDALNVVDMFPQTHHVECVAALRRS